MNKFVSLAAVESFTGGLFASSVVAVPGASKYFKGSLVAYDNEIKEKLGINTSKGVINKETAQTMALKGKEFFNVDVCVAFTGNAGPEALEGKPVGKTFIAINNAVFELDFKGNREEVRRQAVEFALLKLF